MRLNKPSGSQEAFLLQHSLNPQIFEILIAAIYQESNVYKLWSKHLYGVLFTLWKDLTRTVYPLTQIT